MGLGPGGSSLYRLGNGETYYDIWDILNDVEQHDARLQIAIDEDAREIFEAEKAQIEDDDSSFDRLFGLISE